MEIFQLLRSPFSLFGHCHGDCSEKVFPVVPVVLSVFLSERSLGLSSSDLPI